MDKIVLKLVEKSRFLISSLFPHSRGFEPSIAGCLPNIEQQLQQLTQLSREEDDKKLEGFVWGVPKKRRSLQVRWSRNMGAREWVWKMLEPKTNLRTCDKCGHHYEARHLCRNCYEKVKKESKLIRETIEEQLANTGEDKSVVVFYENEKEKVDTGSYQDKMIVEVPKPRPRWFSKNLLQKTTAGPDFETTTVVPKTNLG